MRGKIGVLLILMTAILLPIALCQEPTPQSAKVNTSKFSLEATPSLLVGSGWVTLTFTNKQTSTDFDVLYRMDNELVKPSAVQYYQPRNVTTIIEYTCKDTLTLDTKAKTYKCEKRDVNGTDQVLSEGPYSEVQDIKVIYFKVEQVDWGETVWNESQKTVLYDEHQVKYVKTSYLTAERDAVKMMRVYIDIPDVPLGKQPETHKYDIILIPKTYYGDIIQAKRDSALLVLDPFTKGTTNMISYWTLDETSNTSFIDYTGRHSNTSTTALTTEAGIIGNSRLFASTKTVGIADATDLFQGTVWSFNFWYKGTTASTYETVFSRTDDVNDNGMIMQFTSDNKVMYGIRSSAGTLCAGSWATGSAVSTLHNGSWHMITWKYNGTRIVGYVDNITNVDVACTIVPDPTPAYMQIGKLTTFGNDFNGSLDEIGFWNNTYFNSSDVSYLWNLGAPGIKQQPPFVSNSVTLQSRTPADLNISTVINQMANFTYQFNLTNELINTTALLYHKTNTSQADYVMFTNGSIQFTNFTTVNSNGVVTNASTSENLTYTLYEYEILPATYNILESTMRNTAHNTGTLQGVTQALKIQFLNVTSNNAYNFFEIMLTNRSATIDTTNFYYCNSSYTTGTYTSSANCVQFNTRSTGGYDHTHSAYQSHINVGIPINATGYIGSVKVTPLSYIIVQGTQPPNAQGWYYHYINDTSRTGAAATTSNTGTAWTNQTWTPDAHLHQWNGTEIFYAFACGNDSSSQTCSGVLNDTLEADIPGPTAPIIVTPIGGYFRPNTILNISWNPSTAFGGRTITSYNLTVYDGNEVLNMTINSSETITNDQWNISLSDGTYHFHLIAKDSSGAYSQTFESQDFIIDGTPPSIKFDVGATLNGTFNQLNINIITIVSELNPYSSYVTVLNSSGFAWINYSNLDIIAWGVNGFLLNTTLFKGVFYLNSTANDSAGNMNFTETREITLKESPLMKTPTITPTTAWKNTVLQGYCNATDGDADNITYSYIWYLAGTVNKTGTTSLYQQGVNLNVDNVTATAKSQSWILSCIANDGIGNSSWLNSSANVIQNSNPTIDETISNYNQSHTINITFDMNCSDNDTDTLSYSINDTYSGVFSMNSTTGIFLFDQVNLAVGDFQISASCSDGTATTSQNINITLTNQKPYNVTVSPIASSITYSSSYLMTCSALDDDNDTLTYAFYAGIDSSAKVLKQNTTSNTYTATLPTLSTYYYECSASDLAEYTNLSAEANVVYISVVGGSTTTTQTKTEQIIPYDDIVRSEIAERDMNPLQALIFRGRLWLGLEKLD